MIDDLMEKEVKVISGYYKGQEGVVKGETVDRYLLIMPESKDGFWAEKKELLIKN